MPGLNLTEEQRQQLERLLRNDHEVIHRRARLLLLYDDGSETAAAAMGAGMSRSQARHWKHQFQLKGMAIFPAETSSVEEKTEATPDTTEKLQGVIGHESIILKPPKHPGITSQDSLAEAGRKVWRYQFGEMLRHEEATRCGEDIEALHLMRVATRRMRTAFKIFGSAYKPKTLKPFLNDLRAIGGALGRVRDIDVLVENAVHFRDEQPVDAQAGIEPLLTAWRGERETARQRLLIQLDSQEYLDFKSQFGIFVDTPGMGMRRLSSNSLEPHQVREIVPVLLYSRLARVRAYETILDNASVTQLHALRIEFKRLRYTAEYFREVLGNSISEVINDLKGLQDHLGELHDRVVACQLINEFLNQWESSQAGLPLVQRQNPEAIVEYLAYQHAERYQLIINFPRKWAYFNRPEIRQNLAGAISVL